ncbi:hypothetical protein FSP39_001897 [Pinctada imbricata]|uniref:Uncharacterized protein n=1 Tax=Pinctada imbricata TaxID=66713 RepID=A0AA89C2A9_PINIB|nr:hypothetical protein FSP39_001897 [Pinctada imbricata]
MTTLSPLSRGYGSWTGTSYDPYHENIDEDHFPHIHAEPECHRHGVTVGHLSRSSTSMSMKSMVPPRSSRSGGSPVRYGDSGQVNLPKTFLTRKGALMLFTAPETEEEGLELKAQPRYVRGHRAKNLIDTSLKLGTIDRLALSILQYGDEEYEKENASISDEKNKMFLKFLRKSESTRGVDSRSQPGSDLRSYLRDLKYRSSFRVGMSGSPHIPRSRETMELQAILRGLQNDTWPLVYNADGELERSGTYSEFTRPASQQSARTRVSSRASNSTPRSILSSQKLRESLKSYGSYLGRPKSAPDPEVRHPMHATIRDHRPASPSASDDHTFSSGRQPKWGVPSMISGRSGSIIEEGAEDARYDELNLDAMTGIDGSTIAYTESTELDKHMYTLELQSGDRNFHLNDSYYSNGNYGDSASSVGIHGDGITPDGKNRDSNTENGGGGGAVHGKIDVGGHVDVEPVVNGDKSRHSNKELDLVVGNENVEKLDSNVEDKNVGTSDHTAESYKGSIKSDTLNEQYSSVSRLDNLDIETSTTMSEELVDPLGINRIDIKTHVTGTIKEEEQGFGVQIAYKGQNPLEEITEGSDYTDVIDAALAAEGEGEWEKQAEAATLREAEEIDTLLKGEENGMQEQHMHEVETSLANEQLVDTGHTVTVAQQIHSRTSPIDSKPPHPSSPTHRPSSVSSQRRHSVMSARSRTTPTPPGSARRVKTPSPIGIVKAPEPPPTPEKKSRSPTSRKASEVGSRPSSQYSKRSPTPDSTVGKVTPMEVVITRKPSGGDVIIHSSRTETPRRVTSRSPITTDKLSRPETPKGRKSVTPPPPSPVQEKSEASIVDKISHSVTDDALSKPQDQSIKTDPSLARTTDKADTSQTSIKAPDNQNMVEDISSRVVEGGMPPDDGGSQVVAGGTEVVAGGVGEEEEVASVASSLLQEQDIVLPKEEIEENKTESPQSDEALQVKDEIAESVEKPVKVPSPASPPPPTPVSTSRAEEKVEQLKEPKTLVEEPVKVTETPTETKKDTKTELPTIPDYLKPKPQKPAKGRPQPGKAKKPAAKVGKRDPTKAMSVASVQPEGEKKIPGQSEQDQKIVEQQYTLYEHKKVPKEKEKAVMPDFVSEALNENTAESKEELEKQMQQIIDSYFTPVAVTLNETLAITEISDTGEGLTAEEMELAKKMLQEKVAAATEKIDDMQKPSEAKKKTAEKQVKGKEKVKGKKGAKVSNVPSEQDIIKMQKEIEKQKKEEELKMIEEKIKEKQENVEDHDRLARDKEIEIQLEIERLKQQEDELQQADDEVREHLAESRKKQREEMRERKKANLDRKKQLAKERFEAEKKRREEESKKALAELDRIHDEEIRKQKRLEEEIRREEEERLALEKEEEEEKERIRLEEEHERRMMDILVEEEERAMKRLEDEREEASRQRRILEEERQKILEEEEKKRIKILEEQKLLEDAIRKKEEEEEKKREEERMRYLELKKLEEEARLRMQKELEARREAALDRRKVNLERKDHMNKIKQSQGITRAWIFSYFVRWPIETYNIPFGGLPDPKNQRRAKPKNPPRPKTAS